MRTRSSFAVSLWLLLSACGVAGSGQVTTLTPSLPAFKRVSIGGGAAARGTVGAQALTIRIDDNLASLLETTVENEVLIVRPRGLLLPTVYEVNVTNPVFEGVTATGGTNLQVPATAVDAFELTASGGSNVNVTGIASRSLRVTASGGSNVIATGAATSGEADLGGGSNVNLRGVPLDTLTVTLSSGSELTASVATRLSGNASGGSSIVVSGMPTNQVTTSGGSTVTLGAP